jgi:hypothetical protein
MNIVTRAASHLTAYDTSPQQEANGVRSWIIRAANFVVCVSEVEAGGVLERSEQADEYMALLTPGTVADIEADRHTTLEGVALAIVPPGRSRIVMRGKGTLVRIFSADTADMATAAANSALYEGGVRDVAPLDTAYRPPGGYSLRCYPLKDYESVTQGSPFMLFRSARLMANIFKPFVRPRDTTRLSPHHHDDFEQCSLALSGTFVHRLRYPWGPDLGAWRADAELRLGSPSLLIIPPRVIHTTYVVSPDGGWLVDLFAPARADFVAKPGLVLNAGDYPAGAVR